MRKDQSLFPVQTENAVFPSRLNNNNNNKASTKNIEGRLTTRKTVNEAENKKELKLIFELTNKQTNKLATLVLRHFQTLNKSQLKLTNVKK